MSVELARRLLPPVVAAALIGAWAASSSNATQPARTAKTVAPPMLGISTRSAGGTLAWFDPETLQTLRGRKAPLAGHLGSWAFSPDRSILATALSCDAVEIPEIRFVNARGMRVLGDRRLPPTSGACIESLTWLEPDRLLAVVGGSSTNELEVVDPVSRRVLRRDPLPGEPWAAARSRDELVLMFGTYGAFVPARVVVVDADGVMRTLTVGGVLAGNVVEGQGADFMSREIFPGFAVDPEGRRAFLLPASGPVAEVDLDTLAVSYHDLDRPSLLGRIARWLVPAAEAKALEGPVRQATWLGDGKIALSGTDYSAVKGSDGNEIEIGTPAGVSLVDTRSWTSEMLSDGSSAFTHAADLVIAQGGRWDPQTERTIGPGLVAFGLDGRERWRLHVGEDRSFEPAGAVGYVRVGPGSLEVVDIASGIVSRTLRRNDVLNPWPRLLASQQAPESAGIGY